MSFSKKIKASFKNAVKFINDFEHIAAELAIENGYSFVVCGHIHQPEIREIVTDKGKVTYLNSGDWVENLTALEYHNDRWDIFRFKPEDFKETVEDADNEDGADLNAMLDIKVILEQVKIKG